MERVLITELEASVRIGLKTHEVAPGELSTGAVLTVLAYNQVLEVVLSEDERRQLAAWMAEPDLPLVLA